MSEPSLADVVHEAVEKARADEERKPVTLTEFLLARIAEDEAVAREATNILIGPDWWAKQHHGRVYSGHWVPVVATTEYTEPAEDPEDAVTHYGLGHDALDHIALHDPARVLAECEAKRRIVEVASERKFGQGGYGTGRIIMQHMAAIWSDHPDYRAPSDEGWPVWDDDPIHVVG